MPNVRRFLYCYESLNINLKNEKIMPEFGSPFSGLAKERKLTDAELVREVGIEVNK